MSNTETLFRSTDPPMLRGSRCRRCETVVFPAAASCPRDGGEDVQEVDLPRTGEVWSWTVQTYEPRLPWTPPPTGFEPFAVGYVDLGDVIVEARLGVPESELQIGMPVALATMALPNAAGGTTLVPAFVAPQSVESLR